jgi:hypothetical protein
MKQYIFELHILAWNRMCLWTSYHFVHETECIDELRIILRMKQNVLMSFIPFLHLTDIISPYNINWLLFVMEIGVLSETPLAFLNIIKPISAFLKIRPVCILHCISTSSTNYKTYALLSSRFVILFLDLKFFLRTFLIRGSVAAWKCVIKWYPWRNWLRGS